MSSSERTAQRFTEFLHARARGFMRKTYKANKLRARGIGEEMGIRVPLLLGQFSSPSDIDFGSLPDRFVLKPTSEFGRRGVYLLHRQPDGGYLDLMSRLLQVNRVAREAARGGGQSKPGGSIILP